MSYIYWLISFFGRGCIAAIFVLSGIQKVLMWDQTLGYMSSHDLPFPEILLFLAAATEVFLGLFFFLGIKQRLSSTILALYLIPVTYVFHSFWMIQDPALQMIEYMAFMKNLSIFGGLVCLSVPPKQKIIEVEKK